MSRAVRRRGPARWTGLARGARARLAAVGSTARSIAPAALVALAAVLSASIAPSGASVARAAIRVEAPDALSNDRGAVAAAIDRALPDLETFFGAPLAADYLVTIAASRPAFVVAARGVPAWGIGVAIPSERRVVLLAARAAPAGTAIAKVAVHEVAHLFIHEAGGDDVPRWLDEGLAIFLSGEDRGASFWDLALAIVGDNAYYLGEIETRFPAREGAAHLAYYESLTAVQFIVRRWGAASIPRLLRETRAAGFDAATAAVLGMSPEEFEEAWETDLRRRTRWVVWTAGGVPAASLFALLFLAAVIRKRIAGARKLARWEAEERRAAETDASRAGTTPPVSAPGPRGEGGPGPGTC